jgi:large subunit ribosomal protein L15
MQLIKLKKNTKRIGRGPASGKGKTSGRGMNGQRSRTGSSTAFKDGGQTKFFMRLPKAKGFKKLDKNYTSINASRLNGIFSSGEKVTREEIVKRLKIDSACEAIKVFSLKNLKEKLEFDDKIILSKTKK